MKENILINGVKVIYEQRIGEITSFCIGFKAGASEEKLQDKYGIAHAVEHCIFKGTKNRTEKEINDLCDEIFGFNNAMTNFPYVVYYGTTLSKDFEAGFELYSDIIINPSFPEEGFEEEKNIICEELNEWKDDKEQFCEDELLKNAFNNIRIKECIIGNHRNIKKFTLDDIKEFYNKYYIPSNCVISVVSSLSEETVMEIIERYMLAFKKTGKVNHDYKYENNKSGLFYSKREIEGARIQYIFPIHSLTNKEIKALRIFNNIFGEGTSSFIYDEIRTKYGLAYEIYSKIKNEGGIKLYTINMGTSKENIAKSIEIIDNTINEAKQLSGYFTNLKIKSLEKSIKLKRALELERSIQLAAQLCTHYIMYGTSIDVYYDLDFNINENFILKTVNKVLQNPSIQVVEP
ncbi:MULTISPECIES: M16 family metallopeptidase [Clostridium]|uniref:M16 family metallopeptidase n=1 Tax=Clostridium TaxID=1485 RepID=UPI00069FA149|nr:MULTISPECIES: pitrilysin family protein [Clostridium]KOF56419.1 peptidase M16 [Clostridium sp. DMHC 10]MCD2345763.1 insulinase family protein [Clostridium guangxiense]